MKLLFKPLATLIFGLVLIVPLVLLGIIMHAYLDHIFFEKKLVRLLDGQGVVQTTAAELFGVKKTEFICLIRHWPSDRPSELNADFSALGELGLTANDIPNYNDWFYDLLLWEFEDNFVMAFSHKKKLRLIHKLKFNGKFRPGSDPVYGCFPRSMEITINSIKTQNGKSYAIVFPNEGVP